MINWQASRRRLRAAVRRPEVFVFAPALLLAGWWFGAGGAALVGAITAVALTAPGAAPGDAFGDAGPDADAAGRAAAECLLDKALAAASRDGLGTACLALALDGAEALARRHGAAARDRILAAVSDRLGAALRGGDGVIRLDGPRLAVCLAPVRQADLESLIQIAARLQTAAELPLALDGLTLHPTLSVGFCLAGRAPDRTGAGLLAAACRALEAARQAGPGAIRAYGPELGLPARARRDDPAGPAPDEIARAFEAGQIRAHFQPQLCTDTGAVSGMEALARWDHPGRGLVSPAAFLPALQAGGLSGRLCDTMLAQALAAIRAWDRAGLAVPRVAVNFCHEDLRDARLPDRIRWELDRFDLAPQRLTVEILETVVADAGQEVVARNVALLAGMGCGIDLDDFGTGQSSIAHIRRFAVNRLKIDRSFVARVDSDPAQRRMVAAILSLAERLELDCVGEGVETAGEHTVLAQLGCAHVQGYAIARPMPAEAATAWLGRARNRPDSAAAHPAPPGLGRAAAPADQLLPTVRPRPDRAGETA
ncbi:bifunctional diguanylate cyclase/phosphodiesterase [Frigidibacter oleivorans]|uniref:bifunctional diguanylate cyclase/phosphodiesterase n=1 Tax=Frigidibacter oleivorans TaxID=2487129 RepID=UPI000F8D9892|nr:bifunctional diguanylate cyclase/phosphodiesterase [Frigidibacter oleivorans]